MTATNDNPAASPWPRPSRDPEQSAADTAGGWPSGCKEPTMNEVLTWANPNGDDRLLKAIAAHPTAEELAAMTALTLAYTREQEAAAAMHAANVITQQRRDENTKQRTSESVMRLGTAEAWREEKTEVWYQSQQATVATWNAHAQTLRQMAAKAAQ